MGRLVRKKTAIITKQGRGRAWTERHARRWFPFVWLNGPRVNIATGGRH
jgi:hypothetical protein